MSRFSVPKLTHNDAAAALAENLALLTPEKHKAARNLTILLGYLLQQSEKMTADIDLPHKKLQPVLKYLEEENHDWRGRYDQTGKK